MLVYIGTYTRGADQGIYVYRLDPGTGALQFTGQTAAAENPSFLAIHPSRRYLYAACEVGQSGGRPGGGVAAFAIDAQTGGLAPLNTQSSMGAGPCYVSTDADGSFALVANYSAGSVAALPIAKDGQLGEATDVVQHQGSGPNERRQAGPHAHCVQIDPTNRFAVAVDLGMDRLLVYRLERPAGKLVPHDPKEVAIHPGAGPRHLAFHPSGRYAYVINELDSTLCAFAYEGATGRFTHLQTITTLPQGFTGTNYPAEVQVAPSGRFVYGSNRGHDSIALFAVDDNTGKVTSLGHEPTGGKNPRNFRIEPNGQFLLTANQDTNNVVVFRVDAATGKLQATGHTADVPKPVCIKYLVP